MNPATEMLITAKQAEAFIPDLDDFVGDFPALSYFRRHANEPPGDDANVLLRGDPGSGKTALAISFIRKKLKNPKLFSGDVEQVRLLFDDPHMEEHDARFFQKGDPGKLYAFVRIDGATDKKARLDDKVQDAIWNGSEHTYLLLDEAGELFFRGMEECLRPVMTSDSITMIATAQNFHSKRRTDSKQEEDDRLRAFLRRFTHDFTMMNPTPNELALFLIKRMKAWKIKLDQPDTVRLLVRKSSGVVGYALRQVVRAIDEHDRTLTRAMVESGDADPLSY